MSKVVFTVGNRLRGDDGAGPLLAELLEADPAAGWTVVDGESSPENHTHRIRALMPRLVLIVDAAEMQLAPGEVRRLDEDCVAEHFLLTTHAIPLNFLIASLKETVPEVAFIGIQPGSTMLCGPITPSVRRAVERIHHGLVHNEGFALYEDIA
jgi:hydrogenase 3 maturation protease